MIIDIDQEIQNLMVIIAIGLEIIKEFVKNNQIKTLYSSLILGWPEMY